MNDGDNLKSMDSDFPFYRVLVLQTLVIAMAAAYASASAQPVPTSRLAAVGTLAIKDRYNKTTQLDVRPTTEPGATITTYSSGDAITAGGNVIAVRVGIHVGIVKSGNLWTFPLRTGDAGAAEVEFDGSGVAGTFQWRVDSAPSGMHSVKADVVVPLAFQIWSANQFRLTGKWLADFDESYPVPIRSEWNAQGSDGHYPAEVATNLWEKRP